MRSPGRAGAVVGVVVLFASCRQIVGVVDREEAPASTGGQSDGSSDVEASSCSIETVGNEACGTCLTTSCCSAVGACAADAACKQSLECLMACAAGDEGCRAACGAGFGPLLAEALACRAKSCAVPCKVDCGEIFGVAYPGLAEAGCSACVRKEACVELTECAQDAACIRHLACADRVCPLLDRSCITKCRFEAGKSAAADVVWTRVASQCGAECRIGTNWDCVNQYSWSVGTLGPVALDVSFVRATTNAPISGAEVRVCNNSDFQCANPMSKATTDANGHAHFDGALSLPGPVMNQYLDLKLDDAVDAGAAGPPMPTLMFVFPPVAGPIYGSASYTPSVTTIVMQNEWELVANAVKATLDPALGHVAALIHDCSGGWGSGLVIEASPMNAKTKTYYSKDGVPSADGTATDRSGGCAVVNLDPGPVTLTARLASTNAIVADATVVARAGWLTAALMAPRPKQ